MKTNRKSHILRFIVFAALMVGLFALGLATGLIPKGIFRNLRLDLPVLLKLLVMIFGVLMVESLLSFLLSLPHPENHRARSVLSIVSSILKYIAAIVILCWGLSILGVNVSTIVASVGIVALILGFSAESLITDPDVDLVRAVFDDLFVEPLKEAGIRKRYRNDVLPDCLARIAEDVIHYV